MLPRKRGQTNKQYIRALEIENTELNKRLQYQVIQLNELIRAYNVVPISEYIQIVILYNKVVDKLKYYNLWTGD